MRLFNFLRRPFGLTNAPATFSRFIELCLGEQNFKLLLIYLDYIIIFLAIFPKHLERLDFVLTWQEDHGLKLKSSEC